MKRKWFNVAHLEIETPTSSIEVEEAVVLFQKNRLAIRHQWCDIRLDYEQIQSMQWQIKKDGEWLEYYSCQIGRRILWYHDFDSDEFDGLNLTHAIGFKRQKQTIKGGYNLAYLHEVIEDIEASNGAFMQLVEIGLEKREAGTLLKIGTTAGIYTIAPRGMEDE